MFAQNTQKPQKIIFDFDLLSTYNTGYKNKIAVPNLE